MKYQKLQVEMTRYHDNVRPRHFNPTFQSSNVGVTMGTSLYRSHSTNNMMNRNYSQVNTRKQQPISNETNRSRKSEKQSPIKITALPHHKKSQSNLISYGVNSLGPLRKQITDKDIYEKQQKKYNIVTIQPKDYMDSIKIYPKYRLQNSDENYYKKVMIQSQLKSTNRDFEQNKINRVIDKKLEVNPEIQPSGEILSKPFRGKMLNNVDELGGIL